MELQEFSSEILVKIFWHINKLPVLFTVSKKFFNAAYCTMCMRLPLEADNPLREAYIKMISEREYANDWQLRIKKNYVLAEIESKKDHESSDYEEWLSYIEDDDPDTCEYEYD